MKLEQRTTERDGTLAYGVAGEGPVVVLLHGWPESQHAWHGVWPTIVAAGHTVIVPDLRGVGGSDRSPSADYSWAGYAADLDTILTAEGVDHPMLVGHDMGGVVMFEWGLRNPERVASLVAISTSFHRYELRTSYYLVPMVTPGLGRLVLRLASGSRRAFAATLRRNTLSPDAFSDADVDVHYRAAGSAESRRAIAASYREFFRNRRRRERELGDVQLTCPALVIWGTKEWALGDDGWRRITADLPQAQVEIVDAGHFVMEEQPAVVANLLTAFLQAGNPSR
jgi:pimeloyl-ACP methyl ester carboxylesterase